jgi:hypothetical protein
LPTRRRSPSFARSGIEAAPSLRLLRASTRSPVLPVRVPLRRPPRFLCCEALHLRSGPSAATCRPCRNLRGETCKVELRSAWLSISHSFVEATNVQTN